MPADTLKPSEVLERACPVCGEELRLAWIGFDPPEPYGDVCGCPDPNFEDARADKAASDAPALAQLHSQLARSEGH